MAWVATHVYPGEALPLYSPLCSVVRLEIGYHLLGLVKRRGMISYIFCPDLKRLKNYAPYSPTKHSASVFPPAPFQGPQGKYKEDEVCLAILPTPISLQPIYLEVLKFPAIHEWTCASFSEFISYFHYSHHA